MALSPAELSVASLHILKCIIIWLFKIFYFDWLTSGPYLYRCPGCRSSGGKFLLLFCKVQTENGEFYYPEDVTDENASFRYGVEQQTRRDSQEIEHFLKGQKAKNTVRKTRSNMNILQKYLERINQGSIEIRELPCPALDKLLCKFFMKVKKQDGSEYEPNSLSSFQRSIQRHLEEINYPGNILKDKAFLQSRNVLAARRKDLVNSGKGNKPQATRALTDVEENKLFESGQFGDGSPGILQRAIWWLLSIHFGFRARDESRKLLWE